MTAIRQRWLILLEAGATALIVAVVWLYTNVANGIVVVPARRILGAFREEWLFQHFVTDLLPSLERLAAGFALATLLGVGVGLLLGSFDTLYLIWQPVVNFLRSIPVVSLLPLALVVLGTDNTMKITVIAYATCWPILLNTTDGVRQLDPTLDMTARVYRITGVRRLVRVVLPAVSPRIFAGMRATLSYALLLLVVSEMIGSTSGVGFRILTSEQTYNIANMWAGILLLGIIGNVVNVLFVFAERRALRWYLRPGLSEVTV